MIFSRARDRPSVDAAPAQANPERADGDGDGSREMQPAVKLRAERRGRTSTRMPHALPRLFATSLLVPALLGCPPGDGDTTDGETLSSATAGGSTDAAGSTGAADTTAAPTTSGASTEATGGSTGGEPAGVELLVCSFFADRVHRFDVATGAHKGDYAMTADLDGALGVVVGPDGLVYVASEEANMIVRYDRATGEYLGRFVWDDPNTPDDETGGLSGPGAVLFGPDGRLYVSSFDADAILRYDGQTGAFLDVFVEANSGGLDGPDAGMVFGPGGDLFVPGYYSDTIARYDGVTGDFIGDFTPAQDNRLDAPRTLVFRGEHLYVANEGSGEILRFDAATGAFVDVFVAAGAGGLGAPAGITFDADGVLYVASGGPDAVLRFDAAGAPLPALAEPGEGGISGPTHITLAYP